MSGEARAVLALLSDIDFSAPAGMNMTTRPFYNDRERGFILSIGHFLGRDSLRIFVANHKNTDRIRVGTFTHESSVLEDMTHAEYVRTFEEEPGRTQDAFLGTIEEAVREVSANLREYLDETRP